MSGEYGSVFVDENRVGESKFLDASRELCDCLSRNAGEMLQHRLEQRQLHPVLLVPRHVGAGEMAHHHLRRKAQFADT